MIGLFKVSGHSLFPLFQDGQRVFCIKIFKFTSLKTSNVVVFEKKPHGLMIKQIKSIKKESNTQKQNYFVQGTDAYSIDSRNFGTLERDELKYKVLFKF